jgi:hypothetical protein
MCKGVGTVENIASEWLRKPGGDRHHQRGRVVAAFMTQSGWQQEYR